MHRIPDMTVLPGPVFFKLAYRLTAYRGVMRELALAEEHDEQPPARPAPAAAPGGRRMVQPDRAALESEPAFNGIFSFGTAGGGP